MLLVGVVLNKYAYVSLLIGHEHKATEPGYTLLRQQQL